MAKLKKNIEFRKILQPPTQGRAATALLEMIYRKTYFYRLRWEFKKTEYILDLFAFGPFLDLLARRCKICLTSECYDQCQCLVQYALKKRKVFI